MSSWPAEIRRREAERRRDERETRRRHKDLERRIRERARLSELDQARLEVEVYENTVDELLSVHKEQASRIDWIKYASAPSPHEPLKIGRHEFSARMMHSIAPPDDTLGRGIAAIEEARLRDEDAYKIEQEDHARKLAEWVRMSSLAKRVLAGQPPAYSEVISDFAPFSEVAVPGSPVHVTVHSPKVVGCVLPVNGREIIPAETKSLTASGKLSVKATPKASFHEIYQGYVCGCVLRLARELFALLPVGEVLVTAAVSGIDDRTGNRADLPILSVAFDRATVERLNFERLDPAEAMENFDHRGDAKTTRRSGEIASVVPLTPEDLAPAQPEQMELSKVLIKVRQLRAEIGAKIIPVAPENVPETLPIV